MKSYRKNKSARKQKNRGGAGLVNKFRNTVKATREKNDITTKVVYKPENKEQLKKDIKELKDNYEAYKRGEWGKDKGLIGDWDVSHITDMSYLFSGFSNFNENINNWVVSKVKNMLHMFQGCKKFDQPLNNWDVSSVTNMSYMFSYCENFDQPLNNWVVSNVTTMEHMFFYCKMFKQPLGSWDVRKVTNMSSMFTYCENFDQPLDKWVVSKVTNMSYMFANCKNFNQPLNNWDVSSVTNMSIMFQGCTSFNQPLDKWNVSKVTNMSYMFSFCNAFNQPLNNWNISNVKDKNNIFQYSNVSEENKPLVIPKNIDVKEFTPSSEDVEDEIVCAICLSEIETAGCKSNVCVHTFHCRCIYNWFDINPTCPLCNVSLIKPTGGRNKKTRTNRKKSHKTRKNKK